VNPLIIVSILTLIGATYASALTFAFLGYSRSALEQRLADSRRPDRGEWLADHVHACLTAVSFVRTALRLLFTVLIVVICAVDLPDGGHRLEMPGLLLALVISIALIWILSTAVSYALARYAGTAVISLALPLLRGVTIAFWPFIRTNAVIDEIVKRLSGANIAESREAEMELLRNIEDSRRGGGLDHESAELLENVVEFRNTDVGEVMTPRTDINAIELTDDLSSIRHFIAQVRHSRIPVYRDNVDNIVGILYVKDLIGYLGEDASDFRLEPILRHPIVVPETKPVPSLLADFQRSEVHMAIVIDEYGGTAGLVTIEDVLEEIVGEIKDEHDPEHEEVPSLVRVDDSRVEVDGRFHIDDLNEHLPLDLPEDDEYDTVGGFLLAQFGRVPTSGESIEANNARFTTLDASPTHIVRIAIELLQPPTNGWLFSGDDAETKAMTDPM